MFKLLQIAFRNIFRHKRRTLFTVSTIVIGVMMLLVAKGFLNGLQREMIQGTAQLMTGEIQIHSRAYAESLDMMPLDKTITPTLEMEQKIKNIQEISAITYRARLAGIISRAEKTTKVVQIPEAQLLEEAPSELNSPQNKGKDLAQEIQERKKSRNAVSSQFIAVGIDPLNEVQVCPRIMNALQPGGRFLTHNDNQALVNGFETVGLLNYQLMEGLKLSVGDRVILMPWDVSVTIVGVVRIDLPIFDKKLVYLPLKAVQQMLYERDYAPGKNDIHEIVIRTKDITKKDLPLRQLELTFQDQDLKVQGWENFLGFFSEVTQVQNLIYWIVLVILLLIVSTGIINTSLMSVMERTREIGTLMSIGYKRKHIVTLFLFENISIGAVGGMCGVIFGILTIAVLHSVGILFRIPGSALYFQIRPEVTVLFVFVAFGFALLATIIAGIYPAYHASGMRPVDALASN